ncbi:MAG: exodeoxyribonuclease V subunit alpha [Myxococcales bacterium]|nr:exodeoxyribonuclease V subunit alpha [Myxococcales bacterium]
MTLPTLDELRSGGVIRSIDYHFARGVAKIASEEREELLLAAAMTSAKLGEGHVCLDLASIAGQTAGLELECSRSFPGLDAWRETITDSPMVSDGSAATPLVLSNRGRLYLRRYWQHEQFLASAISHRISDGAEADGRSAPDLTAVLEQLFPGASEADRQRQAALLASRTPFAVVSGGPGTGKTFTVVKILALLVEQALADDKAPPRMTLLAPTGKAAARLVESIQKAKDALPCSDQVKDAIADDASTIHRALGSIPRSSTRFRHNQDNPLVTDLVLVDEASMVNVALMSRLVAAVPAHARLILLGDKDQLASVDAGAVLGDICNSGKSSSDTSASSGIAQCVTHLTKSYRYKEGSGIEALARAVNQGDADTALEVLGNARLPDVQLRATLPKNRLGTELPTQLGDGYRTFHNARTPEEALLALGNFRVLCAHHSGPASVSSLNTEVRRQLDLRGRATSGQPHYEKQPLMVKVNDYELQLFNGDVGVVMQTERGLRVFFDSPEGEARSVAPGRLPAHDPVYAMSIHKSQGSEFDDIAIVLPAEQSPVLTRELIYTAITRAKKSLTIYADYALLRTCIQTPTRRSSGLRDLLWG